MARRKRAPAGRMRVGVTSRCLRTIEHDGDRRLKVEFKKSGAVYEYKGVSKRSATLLKSASSIGRHFVRNIRNNYPYTKLRGGRPRRKAKRTR
jgi:hypothetical protein